ncbi:WD repeat-containing protein 19 (Intraflagellar transport 144 homolog) [Durusdinium trenchii]|uniref:WD repeat-containing protein 19 (Intraflagellar transport 144 homolog) n=1 Tax=Durusdinium trenchii TaxID=1381693 RepID=A0ABP0RLN3_9DINO
MKALFELDEQAHGRGAVDFAWQRDGSFLASCGSNGLVQVVDRHGQQVDEVRLKSRAAVLCMDWDKDGDLLAVLQEKSSSVALYDLKTRRLSQLDINVKDPRFLRWSRTGPQLAVGSGNGTLLLYRKDTLRQETVVGKHSGAIVCGAWSEQDNMLALGAEDKTVTLTNAEGSTEDQFNLKGTPSRMRFAPKRSKKGVSESKEGGTTAWTLCVQVKGEMLVLYAVNGKPMELSFQSRYGKIVSFDWLSNEVLVVGFSVGVVVAVSTDVNDLGKELFSERLHRTSLTDLVVSPSLERVASCGDSTVHIVDTSTWKKVKSDSLSLENDEGQLASMSWTEDGQILSVGTRTGRLYSFLSKMPMVHDTSGVNIAYLCSLKEIAVVNALDMQRGVRVTPIRVPVEIEPSFVALGHDHIAVGMNNRVWFYRFQENPDPNQTDALMNEQEYLTSVDALKMSEQYSAALCSGQIFLHAIEADNGADPHSEVLPPPESSEATCIAMTSNFLFFGCADGSIEVYSLHDRALMAGCGFRHESAIRQIFPNPVGTRVIFVDECGSGFLYNPVEKQLCEIPDLSAETRNVLWDGLDPCVFVAADQFELSTFVYSPLTINGPEVNKIGPLEVHENGDIAMDALSTQLPSGYVAITSFAGIVTCQTPASQLGKVMLGSHEALHTMERSQEAFENKFRQSLALRKLQDAWNMGLAIKSRPHWLALSGRAMEEMNIDMAIRVWRKLGDAGMVMALERVRFVEDKFLLAGHIAQLFGDYAQAQEFFLSSPVPGAALEMRKDLLHWEQALKLAEKVDPSQIPSISVEYAQQLEFKGDYRASLDMYQSALGGLPESGSSDNRSPKKTKEESKEDEHVEQGVDVACRNARENCLAGITRMTLRVGNIPRGVAMAVDSKDEALCKECAEILVSLKQFPDAATLFEKAGLYEESASIYIKAKNYAAAQPLLEKVTAPKLHLQFARAKEAEKDFRTAMQEYEKGKDMDSVIRLCLDHLDQPEKAFAIVRKFQSATGADMAARYCQGVNDFRGAIEFLLLAKRTEDAFELATAHDTMEVFESALGGDGTPEEYANVAKYYETKQEADKAAEFYAICGQFHKALKLYLQCGELEKATDVVGRARSDMLTHTLIDFLMGDTTGVIQDPVHIFRLYMALGNYPQAARTAMVIAQQERESGNYKSAHTTLYETHRELEARNIRVPQSLRSAFLLLHSYLIVRKRISIGDHLGAARLLSRVAKSISKFPTHVVKILTLAVIECQRAGLKKTAFEYASRLMRPEHRSDVEAKYRTRLEAIVRKRGKTELEDVEDARSESPYASDMVCNFDLMCPRTKNHIPFCIITGRHMVLDDWCICPNSKLPALYSEYVHFLQTVSKEEERVDPILGKPISVGELRRLDDPKPYLAYFASSTDEEEDDEDAAENDA